MASELSGPPVRRLDVHQRPFKNHAKAAFNIEPLGQAGPRDLQGMLYCERGWVFYVS